MNTRSLASNIVLAAAVAMTGACDTSSTGPDLDAPSVAGTWTGTFDGTDMRMVLHQSGSNVTGTLHIGRRARAIEGTVDPTGVFDWGSPMDSQTCTSYATRGMQLQDGASALAGVMVRAQRSRPCEGSGRTQVTQGQTTFTKAF